MGKFRKAMPGELCEGDTIWMKGKVDYSTNNIIDVSVMSVDGVVDWVFGVSVNSVRVKESKDNMSKRSKTKVLTGTAHKTIIRHGELEDILTGEEFHQWKVLLEKIREYDMERDNDDNVVKK